MADKKFSELPAATTPTGSEIVPVVQGGDSKQTTLSVIKTYVLTGLSIAWSAVTGKPTTLAGYGITDAASSAQGALAATAVQPDELSAVATSGSYNDLANKPTILPDAPSDGSTYGRKDGAWEEVTSGGSPAWGGITGTLSNQTDLASALSAKANTSSLATVATSGDYDDLTDKPTLGTAAAQNTGAFATAAQGAKADTAVQPGALATVATTGAYSDLSGKPTLGTAAAAATTDFATAAQGTKADTATQPAALAAAVLAKPEAIGVACSDESTALTSGTAKCTFRMPYAFTLTAVKASLTIAQSAGSIFTVDINEGGTTILSTKLTIDNTEKTSATAATPAVISDASLAADAEITIDIDQIGTSGAAGLKVWLIGHQ